MIKLLVDSASDIDLEESKKIGVELIPMEILIEDVSYYDGVNLSHKEFFEKLIESTKFPQTSQINEMRYTQKLEEMTKNGDTVIVICLSSKLSGTYNQAVKASKNFEDVFVVDSMNACIGERILVQYATRLVLQGLSAKQIVDKLEEKKSKIKVLALLGTLKYLKKGGRISPLVAFAGTMLNIKPVVAIENGEVKLVGKALGSKNGNNLLNELIKKSSGIDFDMPYATGYSDFDTTLLDKYINDSKHLLGDRVDQTPKYMIGSTIGTHIGPGAIAVAFFEK
ncbi:MAG: DegV family protein [Christensenellales bacterium]